MGKIIYLKKRKITIKKTILGFIAGAAIFSCIGVFAGQYIINPNPFPITLNGEPAVIEGYNINDNTYFKLRDISDVVGGFDVDFLDNTITLSTEDNSSVGTYLKSNHSPTSDTSSLEIGTHKIIVSDILYAPPHITSKLYINDVLMPDTYTDGVYAYYSADGEGWNGIYKVNLETLKKTELIKTDEDHVIIGIKDKYLFADGDFTSDFRIYDLEANEVINITEDASLAYPYIDGDKIKYYRVTDTGKRMYYAAELDGSNPQELGEVDIMSE